MKGIYKRGNVYWIRYAGLDGRIIRESSDSEKFRAAEDLLIKRKGAIKEGKMPDIVKIEKHTFRELAEEYRSWAKIQRCFASKEYYIDQMIVAFGNYPLRRISPLLVEQLITARLIKGKSGKPNSPATVNRLLALIKHMMTKAAEWRWVEKDISEQIHGIKFKEEPPGRIRFLTAEECTALISVCEPHLKPIVQMALNTGCRKSEILSLTWEQVDLKNSIILLERTKSGKRRDIPINETVREVLTSQKKWLDVPIVYLNPETKKREVFTPRTRWPNVPYVFFNPNTGKPYGEVKNSFAAAMKRAGIFDFTFHDLRHTFASHLVMNGVDITSIKELLGHATLKMTLRYAHLASAHKARAVSVLDGVFSAQQKPTAQKLHSVG